MTTARIALFLAAMALLGELTAAQARTRKADGEQLNFSAEDDHVQKPTSIPADVLAILSKDELIRDVEEDENVRFDQLPASWFLVSGISLSRTGAKDLVVRAKGPLVGANVVEFWVFITTPQGHKLALDIPAHDLHVLGTRFRGYRMIEAVAMTCCTVSTVRFRLDGEKYTKFWERSEDIK